MFRTINLSTSAHHQNEVAEQERLPDNQPCNATKYVRGGHLSPRPLGDFKNIAHANLCCFFSCKYNLLNHFFLIACAIRKTKSIINKNNHEAKDENKYEKSEPKKFCSLDICLLQF